MAETTLETLAKITGTELVGDPTYIIQNVAAIDEATENDISFIANPRYESLLKDSLAGVVIINKGMDVSDNRQYLLSDDPSVAFQKAIEFFHGGDRGVPSAFTGIHSTAVVHETVQVAEGVTIAPHAVIDENVTIGANTHIGSGVYLGKNVTVGEGCILYPNVVVREECHIGNRVILQPNAVIGSCGFGYATDEIGQHTKLAQLGNVVVEDDVEVGANSTVDRARFGSTKLGRGTKVDNQVQIAHNVDIGENNIIVAQTGIAGSVKTGKRCIMAAQTGIAGHIELADDVILAATAKTHRSIKKAGAYGGVPAVPANDFRRNAVVSMKLYEHLTQIRSRLDKLESCDEQNV